MGRVWTEETLENTEGLKVAVRWARTIDPDFSHYGRFITRATDALDTESALKNPRCWKDGRLVRTDLMPYFAVERSNIVSQVDEICPDEGDTARREEAMAFVEATWAPLIERIGDGDYRALDIEVVTTARESGVELSRQSFYDIEVNEDEVDPERWTVMTLVQDNGLVREGIIEARDTLRSMLPVTLLHGLTAAQSEALLLAVQFFIVNAEDGDEDYAAAKGPLAVIEAQLKGEGVA